MSCHVWEDSQSWLTQKMLFRQPQDLAVHKDCVSWICAKNQRTLPASETVKDYMLAIVDGVSSAIKKHFC